MADDLGVNWWEEDEEKEAEPPNLENAGFSSTVKRKLKDDEIPAKEEVSDAVIPSKKKRKRNRKRITEEKLSSLGGTPGSLKEALMKHFNKLSAVEVEELTLQDHHFTTCNSDKDHTLASYLKAVLPKWHRISSSFTHKMSPLILVISGNALRASNLNTEAKLFKGKECKSLKLFSRHIKIDEQIQSLKSNVTHFAVGTPERIRALLQQGFCRIQKDFSYPGFLSEGVNCD